MANLPRDKIPKLLNWFGVRGCHGVVTLIHADKSIGAVNQKEAKINKRRINKQSTIYKPKCINKTTYSPRRENSIDLTAEFEAELVDLKWLASSSVFES